jgi:uncharacterized protein (TIGR01777 family)
MSRWRVIIPGGSGQIGQVLARHFHGLGHQVTVIARRPAKKPWRHIVWDGQQLGSWADELDGADIVINLAGRSVDCRYTPENRREIKESRVHTTTLIGQAIARASKPPALWMNASTATIYRHALDRDMDEYTGELGTNEPGAPATWNFSIDVARSWEQAFFDAPAPRTRKVALRSAMVMGPTRGGIFDTLLKLVRLGVAGTAASGEQYISWVHEADFLAALDFLIQHAELDGIVNIAAPNPLPNRDFMRTLRKAWGTPIGIPATVWMLEAGAWVLRTETELILKSRRVIAARLRDAGFEFRFPHWDAAARDLIASR